MLENSRGTVGLGRQRVEMDWLRVGGGVYVVPSALPRRAPAAVDAGGAVHICGWGVRTVQEMAKVSHSTHNKRYECKQSNCFNW